MTAPHASTLPIGAIAPVNSRPLHRIMLIAAEVFKVAPRDVLSSRRAAPFVHARFATAYTARRLTSCSYPQIGRALGRDHTTIMSACDRAEQLRDNNPDFARRLAAVMATARREGVSQ